MQDMTEKVLGAICFFCTQGLIKTGGDDIVDPSTL